MNGLSSDENVCVFARSRRGIHAGDPTQASERNVNADQFDGWPGEAGRTHGRSVSLCLRVNFL
jgi:hypothetical protein